MDSSSQNFANIVIFHPAAIGDAVLATPVAATLRLNYPGAKITYWSHASLKSLLLGLCPFIDEFVDFNKELGFFALRKQLQALRPDLFVDLSNSMRGEMLSAFLKVKSLHYQKSNSQSASQQHAVGNFLETVREICPETPERLFPTLHPESVAEKLVADLAVEHPRLYSPLIGIVPGVGNLRPQRAWILDGWIYLVRHLLEFHAHVPVLIGGSEDFELAQRINSETGSKCINLCGQLKLDETAAILACCDVVVSADTGPAHLAVAVGTPVIGLYGATYPARSGPYGYFDQVLDQSSTCQCIGEKACKFTAPGQPGECMGKIMLPEVLEKVRQAVGACSQFTDNNFDDDETLPPGVQVDPQLMRDFEEYARQAQAQLAVETEKAEAEADQV